MAATTTTPIAGRRAALSPRARTIVVMTVTAVLVAAAAWVINSPTSDGVTEVSIAGAAGAAPGPGSVPPDFEAKTVDGEAFRLSDYVGKPVWLTFGASWCGDCRAEAADLQATYAAFRGEGLAVIGVFIQEDAASVREYAGRVGFDFTMTADPQARIAAAYRTLGIPTHVFIGRDGLVREVRIGALDRAEMERLVRELLG